MRLLAPSALSLVALVAIPPTAAHAQLQQPALSLGARVRVSAPGLSQPSVVGRYDGLEADTVLLVSTRTGPPLQIPSSTVTRLELSGGRDRDRGAAVGALVGFGASVVGVLLYAKVCGSDAALAPIGAAYSGVVVGLPVGAILGGTVFAPERWRPIPAPIAAGR